MRRVHLFQLKVHDQYVSLPDSSRLQDITEEDSREYVSNSVNGRKGRRHRREGLAQGRVKSSAFAQAHLCRNRGL